MQKAVRNELIRVRVSKADKAVIADAARRRGQTLSELIRWAAYRVVGTLPGTDKTTD